MDPDDRATLQKFLGADRFVGLLLLITCSNVANLLLLRATRGEQRLPCGWRWSGRGQLVRPALTEGLCFPSCGRTRLLLAPWTGIILAFPAAALCAADVDTSPDARVLGFTRWALLTGVLFSLAPPAGIAARLVAALKDNALDWGGVSRSEKCTGLFASSTFLVLLVVTGVTVRRNQKIVNQNPGFTTRQFMMMSISRASRGTRNCKPSAFMGLPARG